MVNETVFCILVTYLIELINMENIPGVLPTNKYDNETIEADIKNKVKEAISNAPELELIQLMSLHDKNKEKAGQLLDKSTVIAGNLKEFRLILKNLGLSKEDIEDQLAHENAHANKAESLDSKHLDYRVTILRGKNGEYLFQPYARIFIPEDWSEEKIKEVWTKIARAPEEYGNKMSPSDIEMID